ncbi:MAG TPA: CDP-diacylglycerol--glycerol-3-phosphate 3-phosphatidyltransferase [Planctomycetaceae bacterium]|jgi:CDP-diacylglycerol--glycerol-3-phosphate 3-phosphatidyltransferase|nr:CDP-diacylglycerol--glycerol-3-phosphate 3-phosphatidyltransferase [Planctomycetaceae bacterium]
MSTTNNAVEKQAVRDNHYGPIDAKALNLPNCITVSRLVLSFVLFGMISYGGMWLASTAVFIVAAATDAVDGYIARRYGTVTTLGRILDPFVDKIIICGSFIFLLAQSTPTADGLSSGVGPWMTLIVIGREMFITGLRAILEQQGKDFSATMSGKIKMVTQCLAVGACLLSLSPAIASPMPWFGTLRDVLLWLAVLFTVGSGVLYIRRAAQLLRTP